MRYKRFCQAERITVAAQWVVDGLGRLQEITAIDVQDDIWARPTVEYRVDRIGVEGMCLTCSEPTLSALGQSAVLHLVGT
jgi:hypothetical protein